MSIIPASETILIVEDEQAIRLVLAATLEEEGYGTLEAEDGPAALRLIESDARITLMIADIGLPAGMNGRKLAGVARRHRPQLKVLFITGYGEGAVSAGGPLLPGDYVLMKPFSMDRLTLLIDAILSDDQLPSVSSTNGSNIRAAS